MIKDATLMFTALIKSLKMIFVIAFSIGLFGLVVGKFLNENNFHFPYGQAEFINNVFVDQYLYSIIKQDWKNASL